MILTDILFLDIETVSQYPSYEDLPEEWRLLWNKKSEALMKVRENETESSIYGRAGIYAEFGKIICISCGFIQGSDEEKSFVIKSFYGHDEKEILVAFAEMLTKWTQHHPRKLCGHNGKEFDFPYICRRMIIHGMKLPSILDQSGKKPWETPFLDTMEMWKFGDYKNFTSLNLLAHVLGIPTPKDDINGSMVGEVYWQDTDLQRIVTYCQKDVLTAAQVYLRIAGHSLIPEGAVSMKN
jgi:DNA polymerase elongation subunit (family B)